ncbi:unnamed protein product [Strongylus vulgaris]|uniref:Uncharacterized protein n=1 Tax=Strongylus vulgaris TaxID=40348 RepID=A0A3P7LSR9_STRVU|nr:unnamed protein product [Strongylus vulgaris]
MVGQGIAAHITRTVPLLQRSAEVVDILTPTLEVVNSNTFDHSSDEDSVKSDRPNSPQLPHSHLTRRRSSHIVERVITERSTRSEIPRTSHDDGRENQHEDFVEAVAYLRKKSLAPEHFRTLHLPR